ncbi:MAG: prohibitin family protein [Thermotogae bacterium]|nr:prohibitin family protein [Thermotogota bacterium]
MNYDLLNVVVPILLIVVLVFLVYRYGTQEVLVEKGGDIRTARRFILTPQLVLGSLAAILVALALLSVKVVPQGNAGVKFNSLLKTYSIVHEGTVFIMPLFESVYLYDLRVREVTISPTKKRKGEGTVWGTSSDGITVGVEATMWYKLVPENLMMVHRNFGPDYEDRFIRPTFIAAIKYIISKYSAEQLVSFSQHKVEYDLKEYLKSKLEPMGFMFVDAVIRDIKLSPDYEKALEERRIAEQEALKMKYAIKKESLKVERMMVEAKGKAKALSIVGEAIRRNPKILTYMYIEKLSDKIKVLVTDQKNILNVEKLER